jgi:cytochrome c-type biogenesis protein CcmH
MWEWLIFGAIALIGAGFAAAPLLRAKGTRTTAALIGVAVTLAALGLYMTLGRPDIAGRVFTPADQHDLPALVADLTRAVRERPNDVQGWILLGRGYFALGANAQASKALAEAVRLAQLQNLPKAQLASILSDYGVALSQASGMVTPAAEAALKESIAADPKGLAARFYLGLAAAQRGDLAGAEKLWQAVLADTPADAPERREIVDRLAALKARMGGDTPDVQAMVGGLAERLAANPNDLEGWRRLIRSYAVLGDRAKAEEALRTARTHFRTDARATEVLAQTARENQLR